jgi:hypothetical protein
VRQTPRRQSSSVLPLPAAQALAPQAAGRGLGWLGTDMERLVKSSTISSGASRRRSWRRSGGRSGGRAAVATVDHSDIRGSGQRKRPAVMVVIRRELPRTRSVDSVAEPYHIVPPRILHSVCPRSPLHPSDQRGLLFPSPFPAAGRPRERSGGRTTAACCQARYEHPEHRRGGAANAVPAQFAGAMHSNCSSCRGGPWVPA